MAKDKFLLMNLQDEKAKKIAQVIANPSCTKILEYLADKEHATESEISEKLSVPISTVHYNLQQLVKTHLVKIEEYHYSKKGKEINHYKLANKYIIIAPASTRGIKTKLQGLFIGLLFALGGAWILQMTQKVSLVAPSMKVEAAPVAEAVFADSIQAVPQIMEVAQVNPALWFLYGSLFILGVFMVIELIRYWRGK